MKKGVSRAHHVRQDNRRRTPPGSPERSTRPLSTYPIDAVNAAKEDLFITTTRTTDDKKPKTAALNIATAQRLVLADLQHDIANYAEVILDMDKLVEPLDIKILGHTLKEYCRS